MTSPSESSSSPADRSPLAPQLQVGDELHRGFFLQQKLGVGTLGDTWLANDTIDERQVVLKILPIDIQQNPQSATLFRDSYKQVETLRHPSLRGLHPLMEDVIHGLFVVADYLEAVPLDQYYRTYTAATGGQFPLSAMIRVFWPIARVLDCAHSRRLYHRRLTSNNILVGRDCGVQLTDLHYPDVAQHLLDAWIKEEPEFPEKEDQKDFANLIHRTLFADNFFDVDKRTPKDTADNDNIPLNEKDRTVENCAAPILRAIRRATSSQVSERFGSCTDFLRAIVGSPLTDETDSDSTADDEENWDILSVSAVSGVAAVAKTPKHGLLVLENLMPLDDAAFAQGDTHLWDFEWDPSAAAIVDENSMWESSGGENVVDEMDEMDEMDLPSEPSPSVVAEPTNQKNGDESESASRYKPKVTFKAISTSTSTSTSKTRSHGTAGRHPVSWSQLKRHFWGVGGGLIAAVLVLAGMSAMMDFFGSSSQEESPLEPAPSTAAKYPPTNGDESVAPTVNDILPPVPIAEPLITNDISPLLVTTNTEPPLVEEPPTNVEESLNPAPSTAAKYPPLVEEPPTNVEESPLNPSPSTAAKYPPPSEELPLMIRAELGDSESQRTLGEHYLLGTCGYKKDAIQAVAWLRTAAIQRNMAATYSLGKCYEAGFGVPKNDEMAFRLYETAAKSGDVRAELRVGWCYGQGVGTEKNPQAAAIWYRTAAEQGEPQAQVRIGACYEAGVGVETDLTQAKLWYEKAAEQGNQDAADGLKRIQLTE